MATNAQVIVRLDGIHAGVRRMSRHAMTNAKSRSRPDALSFGFNCAPESAPRKLSSPTYNWLYGSLALPTPSMIARKFKRMLG